MKKQSILVSSAFIVVVFTVLAQSTFAQSGRCPHHKMGDDSVCRMVSTLTPDQEQKIMEFKKTHVNEMKRLTEEVKAKRTELQTLETAEKPDQKKINTTIEEIGKIEVSIEKERSKHIQEVRSILNNEQKAEFDNNMKKTGGCIQHNVVHHHSHKCHGEIK